MGDILLGILVRVLGSGEREGEGRYWDFMHLARAFFSVLEVAHAVQWQWQRNAWTKEDRSLTLPRFRTYCLQIGAEDEQARLSTLKFHILGIDNHRSKSHITVGFPASSRATIGSIKRESTIIPTTHPVSSCQDCPLIEKNSDNPTYILWKNSLEHAQAK
ncbi:hypothetical protein J6590_068141 [Homalodisca vitripennis]|nr:hypothetical protein J6590_068141 [Homalodisca vitripennis]